MNLRTLNFTVPVGGEFVHTCDVQSVLCYSATEDFLLSLNDATPIEFSKGLSVRPTDERIRQIRVLPRVGATGTNTLKFLIGDGEFKDARLNVIGGISVAAATNLDALPNVTLVAATNTLLAAANSLRRAVVIRNASSTDTVLLSSFTADLSAGIGRILGPSEEVELLITGAVYGRSTGTPTLYVSEEVY